MIEVNELRKGVVFLFDNVLYKVVDYEHIKAGRGTATIRVKAKNLRTNSSTELTWKNGNVVQDVALDYHNVTYLYKDNDFYYFMNNETFEQPAVPAHILEGESGYLKEGLEVKITYYQDEIIEVELPQSVDLTVTKAEAAAKGNTATSVTKPVEVETGITVNVPSFINVGDVIKINTENGQYLSRV